MINSDVPERIDELDTPDGHIGLIQSQWRDFAAFAWEKYLVEGRGAVVLDLRNASSVGETLQVPAYYVAEHSERLAKRGGWPSDDVAELIKDYDPEQDVVFIVLRLDGDALHYNVSDELTPPRAFEASGKRPQRSH